jgi:hypothetical protein
VLLLQGTDHCSGTFLFLYFLFFNRLAVCICDTAKVLRYCRGWVQLVSSDINIYSLSKKKQRVSVVHYMMAKAK